MSLHQTCRPRAIQIAREIERECIHVVAADVVEPEIGTVNGYTVEVTVQDSSAPPKLLDILARRDAAIRSVAPQGDHTRVIACV